VVDAEFMALSEENLRHAYGMFPSGVTAVCARIGSAPVGLAASSFTSVSIDPPLVSVCVAHTSTTWPTLRTAPVLGISVLAAEHGQIARALAAKTGDRFADITYETADDGAVLVHGATLWLTCVIENEVPAGDHDIIVLRVTSLRPYPDVAPMIFHASKFGSIA
jgi:flavin reductase (DIM6/NTAB) family NADH-FMN oxidoreductase RutF